MPSPPAKFTQRDIQRALKAAQKVGGEDMVVRVLPDGTLEIGRKSTAETQPLAPSRSWVL